MPTELERQGDFSQSFNRDGTLRVIYDPWTSRFGPNGQIIRDPFPGNRIPANRFDPLGDEAHVEPLDTERCRATTVPG